MKAIVIGGCGHIGTYLVPMLVRRGYEVVNITRGKSKPYADDIAWKYVEGVVLDRENDMGFSRKVACLKGDIVIDLINFHLSDTKDMVDKLKGDVSHYLFCSSIWAHGRASILPADPNDIRKQPIDDYGREKFACEMYLKEQYLKDGFPATVIMPGQISGPGWTIINPWGNTSMRVFQKIADGEGICLPNMGMETLHHVHGEDVARMFMCAVSNRNRALGESFHAVGERSITLYGYAMLMYDFFGKEPRIDFLPWDEWSEYEGDVGEVESTYYHIARSGYFSIENAKRLLGYRPKYTNVETIKLAVQSYVDRGLIKIDG